MAAKPLAQGFRKNRRPRSFLSGLAAVDGAQDGRGETVGLRRGSDVRAVAWVENDVDVVSGRGS